MTPALLIGWALVYAGAYVWMGFALGAVLSKTGSQRQVAWVPVKRYVEAARVGDVPTPPVWVARGIALAAWAVFVTFATLRAWDVVAPSPGVKTIASTAFALAVVSSAAAWVAWIVSANRIELRLVAQRRLAWVAAVLPPLWASLIGFGSARPVVVGPVRGADVASPPAEDDATRAIRRVPAPAVQEVEPAPADPEAAEAVEEAMTTDEEDITGKFPRAYSPYDTSAAQAADSSQVQPVEVPPWAYDDDDATFFAKRRRARWALQVVGGEEYDLEDVTTIGREGIRPIPGVLPIVDDTRTVSKLHARLRRESDNWFITDLGSTNGTFVRDAAGNEFEVKAQTEAKVQGTLLLGDLELVIVDLRGES